MGIQHLQQVEELIIIFNQNIFVLGNIFLPKTLFIILKNKTMRNNFLLPTLTILISCIILFSGCNKDDDDTRTVILTIPAETVLNGTNPQTDDLVEVMKATEENTSNTYYLALDNGIEGFTYESGYKYRIKVLITTLKNPPMDGNSETFELIEILEKTKVTTSN